MSSANFKLRRTAAASRGFLARSRLSCTTSTSAVCKTCTGGELVTAVASIIDPDDICICNRGIVSKGRPKFC